MTDVKLKKKLYDHIQTQFFSAEFKKKDGSKRTILGKLPSNDKFFAGGELLGDRAHLLECIDVNILNKDPDKPQRAWRSIQLNNLISLKVRGVELVGKEEAKKNAA